jgi:hypothetical protein
MNALDQIFGWLMIAFGVAQSVTNFRIQSASHLTLSLSGTAAAMIVSGFLNVSRARHSDGLTRAFSVVGNVLILVLAVAWPVRYHLLHNWQALGILVVTVIEVCLHCGGETPLVPIGSGTSGALPQISSRLNHRAFFIQFRLNHLIGGTDFFQLGIRFRLAYLAVMHRIEKFQGCLGHGS